MKTFKGKMMGTKRSKEDLQKSMAAYSKQAEKKKKVASKVKEVLNDKRKERRVQKNKIDKKWEGLQTVNKESRKITDMSGKLIKLINEQMEKHSNQPAVVGILTRKLRILSTLSRGLEETPIKHYHLNIDLEDGGEL